MGLERRQIHVAYAYQRIAEEIESQILEGTLKPGEQLPGETEMAEMFGVTRSTVREGLRRLESEGLVCRPTPRRLVVAIPRIDRLSTRSGRTMALMKVTYRELWQVTLKTEMLAARLAAEMAKDDEISALKSLHEELSGAEGNASQTIELDGRFHSQVARIGKNRVLGLAREPVAHLLFRGFAQVAPFVPQFYKRQIEAHSNIVGAIEARDPVRAETWARKHIEDFWRGVQIAGLEDEAAIKNVKALS